MKILIFSILLLSFTSGASVMAEDIPIQFRGITKMGASQLFSLSSNESKQRAWISVGDRFAGYAIVAFDPKENVLILRKGGREFRLSLSSAASLPASAEAEEVRELAQLLRELPLEAQGEQLLMAMTAGMDKFVGAVEIAATPDAMLEVLSQHLWEATLWKEVREAAWSRLTPEELATLNDPERNIAASLRLQESLGPYFDTLQKLKFDEPYAEKESLRSAIKRLESIGGMVPPRLEEEL